jgi:nicotinamidase/pyrazinamidase
MKTVFLDIDTQLDFMFPAGALYVPGAERLLPAFAQLTRHAAAHGIPIVSTTDAHQEHDPEFRDWPPHCIWGTLGQHKAAATLLGGEPQIVVRKRHIDVFAESPLAEVLDRLEAHRFVVYGLVTEYCVRTAALGALKRGGEVRVVRDAIASLSDQAAARTFAELESAGVRLVSLEQALA